MRIPLGHRPVVFALPGSRELASKVLFYLGWQEGLCTFTLFGNGEISSKVEETVTNHDVFVFATRDDLASEMNFSLMQLMLFIGALKGESPYRLTVVVPCLDYARQDRRSSAGEGIAATLMLRCLKTAGADRFLTVDLHNEAEVGFAPGNTVLDELSARRYLASFIRENVEGFDAESAFVCATSGGGMGMTRRMATELGIGFMMVDRIRPKAGGKGDLKIMSSEREDTIKSVIVVDDMFDTCGSLAEVCKALQLFAPRARLYAVASHGFFFWQRCLCRAGAGAKLQLAVDRRHQQRQSNRPAPTFPGSWYGGSPQGSRRIATVGRGHDAHLLGCEREPAEVS